MRINQDSKIFGGGAAREPDATVQPLNDSAVAVTEMQCNGRTGSFVSTPRAATGTGRVPVRCQSYDDQMRCRMKSEGVEITLDGSLLNCRANFTGIIIERFDRREKQQGMLCGPCR